jgi:hypothetical protein
LTYLRVSFTLCMVERVAQSVEHLPFKQEVLGSIPSTLTNSPGW